MTDPWLVYAEAHDWEARASRLAPSLRFSWAAASVDHALTGVPGTGQGLLAEARAALWQADPDGAAWLDRLQPWAERVAESPSPDDPPDRAIDALLYAYAELSGAGPYALEALFTAFWALADAACPADGWVESLLGPAGLLAELDVDVARCAPAFQALHYQDAVLHRLETAPVPLTRRDVAALAGQAGVDPAAHAEFARNLCRRALADLRGAPGAELSYAGVCLRCAVFEEEQDRPEAAAEFFRHALPRLRQLDRAEAAAAVELRLAALTGRPD